MSLWRRKRRSSYTVLMAWALAVDLFGSLLSPPLPEPTAHHDLPFAEYSTNFAVNASPAASGVGSWTGFGSLGRL